MEKSLRNPKRVFPFHGKIRYFHNSPKWRVRNGVRHRVRIRFVLRPSDITVPCIIGYERPYGDRWLHMRNGLDVWDVQERENATVFKDPDAAIEHLQSMANNGPTPWSLFFEPIE